MSDLEQIMKTQARVAALEYLMCNLYASRLLERDDPIAAANEAAEKAKKKAATWTLPGVDAALSDLAQATFDEALEARFREIGRMVQEAMGQ